MKKEFNLYHKQQFYSHFYSLDIHTPGVSCCIQHFLKSKFSFKFLLIKEITLWTSLKAVIGIPNNHDLTQSNVCWANTIFLIIWKITIEHKLHLNGWKNVD